VTRTISGSRFGETQREFELDQIVIEPAAQLFGRRLLAAQIAAECQPALYALSRLKP
jgi:hypothetical protein